MNDFLEDMRSISFITLLVIFTSVASGCGPSVAGTAALGDELEISSFEESFAETARTFLDYRYDLHVTSPSGNSFIIPGYLADDFETPDYDSPHGKMFLARIVFSEPGIYEMRTAFCRGENIAIRQEACQEYDSDTFRFKISDRVSDKVALESFSQSDARYLQRSDGSVFLKTGAGSPENILAYADFDRTFDAGGTVFPSLGEDQLHDFKPHLKDARSDDPTWDDGKGAALLGLFNYYEEVGVNSQYLVGMNLHGDGQDVFPYVSPDDPYTFDVSKLAQWQTVFEHANRRGVLIHFLFTETENESFFEVHDGLEPGVDFAPSRKLYYREMVARFGHLPMLIWNLGEENGVAGNSGEDPYRQPTSPEQRMAFADYIASLDTRNHPIVSHNWPDVEEEIYAAKLGHPSFSGISLQAHHNYFDKVAEWTRRSEEAGRPWMVSVDEPLGWEFGARPDVEALAQTDQREEIVTVLWPSLLGGATGVEWYFGWQNNAPTSDLSNEDQRSRDALWRSSAKVRTFFETLPLTEMTPRREGDTMVLEGQGHRLEMLGTDITYTAPGHVPRALDPYNPE